MEKAVVVRVFTSTRMHILYILHTYIYTCDHYNYANTPKATCVCSRMYKRGMCNSFSLELGLKFRLWYLIFVISFMKKQH